MLIGNLQDWLSTVYLKESKDFSSSSHQDAVEIETLFFIEMQQTPQNVYYVITKMKNLPMFFNAKMQKHQKNS